MLKIILVFLFYLLITLPSVIYHGTYNLYLRKFSKVKYDHLPTGSHDVIIFVHGRGGSFTDFKFLINKLKHPPVRYAQCTHDSGIGYETLAFDLGRNSHTSVRDDVETLHQQVDKLLPQINKIILIGLSKGGLTAIQYALTYPQKIEKIITVSSPLNGTYVASYHPFCRMTRNELGYESSFSQELKEKSINLKIYSIVPRWDHLIIPVKSAKFPHSEYYQYEGWYSHVGILYAPEIITIITKWLQD